MEEILDNPSSFDKLLDEKKAEGWELEYFERKASPCEAVKRTLKANNPIIATQFS